MAFLGVLAGLRAAEDPERVTAAMRGWGEAIATVSAERIVRTEWYPYEAFAQLLEGADRDLGDGKGALCFELGVAAAKSDLRGAFAVLKLLASPQHLIGSCERVWPRYYRNAGRMIAAATRPENTVLRILDFPTMSPAHCRMMEGWMTSAMAVLGATVLPGAGERECAAKGGKHHEFACAWKK
ncbi:MAG TPA: hypothetical protein VFG69_02050 [Nannocystaceae bacterium]|nr:hypothetical protein [Nannocystaceae bacterium]